METNNFKIIYTIMCPNNIQKYLSSNCNLISILEEKFHCEIIIRHSEILSNLENDLENLVKVFEVIDNLFENNIDLIDSDFISIINSISYTNVDKIISLYLKKEVLCVTTSGKSIYPRTLNQKLYISVLGENDIIFAIGPAGTGKTYLAVLYAVNCLKKGNIRKIILVRPVVEAGEKLGFLPGDLKEKIDPYLIPLYDGLYEALGKEKVDKMIEKGIIEIAPLAYMRGRTLENSIIILDEAQNATLSQMKMFLTRLGFSSKMIITGDITQIDLVNKYTSGLIEATEILKDIKGIKIIRFEKYDVMRHPLVYKIIEKYEEKGKN